MDADDVLAGDHGESEDAWLDGGGGGAVLLLLLAAHALRARSHDDVGVLVRAEEDPHQDAAVTGIDIVEVYE